MLRTILPRRRRRSRSRFALGGQPERADDAHRPVRTEPLPTTSESERIACGALRVVRQRR
jgi:hypothetical protein